MPAEMIERIEVIRGPAAARYGSGAAGGVVNIITKRPEKMSGSVTTYFALPQHSEEGQHGTNVPWAAILDWLSFRLNAGYSAPSRMTPTSMRMQRSPAAAWPQGVKE
ncbi:TonB-dependent receptor plug domain-containing protein [Pannonibacter sp. Pt2-lr]